MEHSRRLNKWVLGFVAACTFPALASMAAAPQGTAGSIITAKAATVQTVHAVRGVWLRRSPQTSRNAIKLESRGTVLRVLAGGNAKWWHVRDPQGRTGYVVKRTYWVAPNGTPSAARSARVSTQLPPGVRFDRTVHARALPSASVQAKTNAVLAVAKSKLGTPYRWGHNEDRGQYGFDCSNFTAYVYHHALGYKMSGASKVQASSIGWRVPRSSMRPGDLLIFENGKHCGIYVGHNRMIQEGGGLGKVGYLSIGPGSYWGKHLTAVKRMYN
ncbi:C40 family peptidase [Alicyclobacillus ferrooxydans]|uniref:C40 family peptidase n=1 Tax=Alicyclobacillus ferrooxydans TaxID=471514 RepID=UPI000AE1F1A7|nr:NlpC/P60 family protein [Alicyclobacillus ferrooxydans]